MCFQQREPFKKRWFTLCSVNRKLIYYKTPLVNYTYNIYIYYTYENRFVENIFLNQIQGWIVGDVLFDLTRMLWNWVPSSSAQRTTSTRFRTAASSAWEEAAGSVASGCKHPQGSLCSSASRSRIRGSGWKPSEKSLPNPWPQRIMLVRHHRYTWHAAVWWWNQGGNTLFLFLLYCRWSQLEKGEITCSAYWVAMVYDAGLMLLVSFNITES